MPIASHFSSLQAIRHARCAYSELPWPSIDRPQQRKVLTDSIPSRDRIDLSELSRHGIWIGNDIEKLHVLVASGNARRHSSSLVCHVFSSPLPNETLLRISPDTYCCSPALTALQCSINRSVSFALMLIMELLGSYSLPAEATFPIAHGGRWPDSIKASEIDQTHYGCEPAVTIKELRKLARWTKSSAARPFRQAVEIAAEGSASPSESIMFGMFGAPMRLGGFACNSLPKGGMLLNHRLDFDTDAMHMASGMPYAVLDADIPAAKIDLEYNGAEHESLNARIHDGNRNNGIKGMGYKVLVINRDQMRDIVALEAIAKSIHRDAGSRFRYSIAGYRNRQIAWLNGLRAATGLPPA